MLARLGPADDQLAAQEFLVVQFIDRAFRFIDILHLDKGESFRALIMPIGYDLGILHVPNPIKELEEIALRRIKGQIADVKTRRSDLDWFRLARLRSRLLLLLRLLVLLRTVVG